ncbi:hypothetical protein, partial [Mesorhizobium sp.]|uniref:hypothetical protein n=1 Tax=Mesorhizobium sp. TaxID=1871066 RepID=UPI0025E34881
MSTRINGIRCNQIGMPAECIDFSIKYRLIFLKQKLILGYWYFIGIIRPEEKSREFRAWHRWRRHQLQGGSCDSGRHGR